MTSLLRYIRNLRERRAANKVCRKISPGMFAPDKVRKRVFVEDSDLLTSLSLLQSMTHHDAMTETAELLGGLLKGDEQSHEENIRIGDISAITASKGKFIGNLCRLKYTIYPRGSYPLNLPKDKQQSMWNEVEKEFSPTADGFFMVDREAWSDRLIARNTGAARRFCWAQYHNPDRILPCRVTNWRLDSAIIEVLNEKYWLCILPEEVYDRVVNADLTVLERHWFTRVTHVTSIRRDTSSESWSYCAVKRDDAFFPKLRDSLLDAAVPLYDVSSWLLQLQAGRGTP